MSGKIKVIYIMGSARSGSTVLEILLAHGEHCVGVGELTAIVQDGFIENKPCSCGAAFSDCRFWGEVKRRLALNQKDLQEWAHLHRKVDWHTGFLRQWLRLLPQSDWRRYHDYNLCLLHVLHDISGGAVIVDSSKYAGRALALAKMPDVELSVICLTRSPAGLMDSFQKPNKEEQRPKTPWAVLRYYVFVMFSLRVALRRLKERSLRLTYEQFIGDPVSAITRIGEKSHIDFEAVIESIRSDESLEVGHLVTGNRLRKKKVVRLVRSAVVTHRKESKVQIRLMELYNKWSA